MMVAHAVAVTERIRLGTAVIVAPLHMLARLLGEIGLADSFSGAFEAKVARLEHELHTAHTILDVQGNAPRPPRPSCSERNSEARVDCRPAGGSTVDLLVDSYPAGKRGPGTVADRNLVPSMQEPV